MVVTPSLGKTTKGYTKTMFSIIFSVVMSWILFPIGMFKSGLSRWGYALPDGVPRWKSLLNLAVGLATGATCMAYLNDIQPYGQSAYSRFSEIDFSKLTLTDPFAEYLGFFPWVDQSISQSAEETLHYFDLTGIEIAGTTLTPLLFIAGAVVTVVTVFLLGIAALELRIYRQRQRHARHEDRLFAYFRKLSELRTKYDGELTAEQEAEIERLAHKSTAHIKDPGPWKNMFAPITGNWRHPSNKFRFMDKEEVLFNTFFFIEGLITPVITVAYTMIFFGPTLLIIGLWLLAIVSLFIAFMPFAWLYSNGVRVRMH